MKYVIPNTTMKAAATPIEIITMFESESLDDDDDDSWPEAVGSRVVVGVADGVDVNVIVRTIVVN